MAAEEKWYFAKKQLENSPSRKCDIDSDKELSYRQQAANFIQDVGQRLQVSQLCINTAIVYMHRFYVFHSFTQFHRYSMASAALFLAAKVEEQPRKLEHVIKVAHLCLHKEAESTTPATPDVKSEQYAQAAHELVFNENVLLQTLGFDVAIDHPHTHVVRCCHLVKASKDLAQTSYFLASNSLHLTTMCLQYKPTVVACFCIHLACKWSNWEIPPSSEGKPWFTYVDESVTTEMLDELTKEFISIYNKCPSRLKKKIQSMSASLGQSSGSQSSSSQGGGSSSNSQPVNCNSPMTADNKKLQPQHKDQNYHQKAHHNQMKPGIVHPHRPPHDPNLNYNEYKEKKERERQSMGAPGGSSSHSSSSMPGSHHKQLPPGSTSSNSIPQNHKHAGMPPSGTSSSSIPPQNRNPHHRSSNSNVDPKLKMHQQMHPQHSNRPGSQSSSSHPRMPPMDQLHRDQNQHMRNSTNDSSSSREHYRLQQMSRDITAPREQPPPQVPPTSSSSGPSAPPSSGNITSERELMKEQQMRERHQAGGNALQFIENLSKDSLLREVMDRSTPQPTNNRPEKHRPDLFKDLFKDSNNSVNNSDISDKQKYELNKKLSGTPMVVNNVKHESSSSSSSRHNRNDIKSSHKQPPPPIQQQPPLYNNNDQNKNKSTTLNVDKKYPPGGNGGNVTSIQQQRPKQPYTSNTSTPSTDSKLSTSSPGIQQTNDYHRNGNHEEAPPKPILATPPLATTSSTTTTSSSSYKQKSIFSPEKDSPKTPVKKLKTGKTPPGSSGKKYDTVLNDNMVPPALSPFGSPPPVATTPSTPSSAAKNRNRTSSSSSEPELMVVLNKLEYDKYLTKEKDSKIKKEELEHDKYLTKEKEIKIKKEELDYDKRKEIKKEESVVPKEMKTKEENSVQAVNGIETDPTVISNLLKEVVTPPINHLDVKKEEEVVIPSQIVNELIPQESKKSDHHKSDKKKKKDKHKHKDRNREDKEKKKKHKDKDRDRSKKESSEPTTPVAPLKITIPKDKITPEGGSGLKIKIPKDRIKTDTISSNSNQMGGLKIKISKDKIVENSGNDAGGGSSNSGVANSNRKRDHRDSGASEHGAPPTKISKSSSSNSGNYRTSSSSESSRQNGRSSYNNKQQVSLGGEGGQVGGVAVGVLQQQAQWSTQVKLAESKYHSKVPGSNKQPPT